MPNLTAPATLSITRMTAASASRADLACSPDTDDVGTHYTRLMRYNNRNWTAIDLNFHTESLCYFHNLVGTPSLILMSREGMLYDADQIRSNQKIEDYNLDYSAYKNGFLYKLKYIEPHIYAVGSGGQIYSRTKDGLWHVLDIAILDKAQNDDMTWMLEYLHNPTLLNDPEINKKYLDRIFSNSTKLFLFIAGVSEKALYFGGEQAKGILYFWDGTRCSRLDLPTEKALREILIAPDGTVWICGREGLLLRGRDQRFEVALDLGSQPRFASLAWFKDRLYLGSSSGPSALFVYDGRGVVPVNTGLTPELEDAHTLEAVDDVLWVVGMKSLARFDGTTWERIPVPGVNAE